MYKYAVPAVFLLLLIFGNSCHKKLNNSLLTKQAPPIFLAKFETSQGDITIRATRAWSPLAVDRLYQLIKSQYYTDLPIYRVVPNYVAQFGVHTDSTLQQFWDAHALRDEPAIYPNRQGTLAFARSGPNTRSTILYFNLQNNSPRLDTLTWNGVTGFPVVAEITEGLEVIDRLNSQYGNDPASTIDSIQTQGIDFLNHRYPGLDYINKAYILKK